jgi:drug/metabolite transporter (DMT)-like permease
MPTFLLVVVTVVWGSTFFIIKDAVRDVDAFCLVFIRNLIAAVPMSLYVFARDRKALSNTVPLSRGAVLGFLLATTYLSQTLGLRYTTSGHSAFITGSAVIFVPILLFVVWRVQLLPLDVLSILGVFAGLFLLTWDGNGRINPGDFITLITVAAYAVHLVSAGRFVRGTDVPAMIAHQFNFAALFSFAAWLAAGVGGPALGARSLCVLAYLGLCGTLFCYFVTVWAQKHVSAVQVALIFALEPVFAALFARAFAGETLRAKELFGMSLILAGVILYQVTKTVRAPRRAEKLQPCS